MKLKTWHERQLARDPDYATAIAEIDYAQRVADAVVGERVRLGLTQEELAERAGTTQARISELERGVGNSTMDTVERVFVALRAVASNTADAGNTDNLLAAITTVKAAAFGFTPAGNSTIVVGTGTGFFAAGITVDANMPFVPLGSVMIDLSQGAVGAQVVASAETASVQPEAPAAANSELALAA